MKEKLCSSCQETKVLSEFTRPNAHGRPYIQTPCNDCWQYQQKLERIKELRSQNSLTPTKPKNKPVWMVIYSSFP